MKTASSTLINFLTAARASPDIQFAFADCYTFTLTGGTTLTYTNADVPIVYAGKQFLANGPLVSGLKYRATTGLNVDRQEIMIAARLADLTSGAAFLVALRDGAFDGAMVQRDRVFFSDFIGGTLVDGVMLFHGRISTVDEVGRTKAKLTVANELVLLDIDMPRNIFAPTCLHTLFDLGCGLPAGAFSTNGVVGAASTTSLINFSAALAAHLQGKIVFSSGANAGAVATVKYVVAGTSLTPIIRCRSRLRRATRSPSIRAATTRWARAGRSSTISRISARFPLCRRLRWRCEPAHCTGIPMREKIVAEARSWIGTRYHNCADIKGVGVDCGMLLVRVFVDFGLVEPFDPRPYTHDWHMHRDEERYLDLVLARAQVETPIPGDVMLFRVGRCYSHGGIVTRLEPLTIIHASFRRGSFSKKPSSRTQ